MDATLFQYCQKIVLFNDGLDSVLLAKRRGEADFDGVFSLIGGKMETTDGGILEGLSREKNEEVGEDARVDIYIPATFNEYYIKKNGQAMVLPHFYAIYRGGDVILNDEYSEYAWVKIADLDDFGPKIDTITAIVNNVAKLEAIIEPGQLYRI